MITITPNAAERIRSSAREAKTEGMALRLAAKRDTEGRFQYAMGFDDTVNDGDTTVKSEGIDVVVAPMSQPLLTGAVLDYVEVEAGQPDFIFMNPNDPTYEPPQESDYAPAKQ